MVGNYGKCCEQFYVTFVCKMLMVHLGLLLLSQIISRAVVKVVVPTERYVSSWYIDAVQLGTTQTVIELQGV